MTNTDSKLNSDQQKAALGFLAFLMGDDRELCISGPGGVGKTFLMGYMIDDVIPMYQQSCSLLNIPPKYDTVVMTATTNKAAETLSLATNRPAQTIHSYLGLKVNENRKTGETTLVKSNGWSLKHNTIIFIDEASIIDTPLKNLISESTHNCKIVYVGDHCQLPPIMEKISPVYRDTIPVFELLEPMRNKGQDALQRLCKQLRDTVETGVFHDIQKIPGVIEHLTGDEMESLINSTFTSENNSKILAYTNQRVAAYNSHIRGVLNYTEPYVLGEELVNTNMVQLPNDTMPVEEVYRIAGIGDSHYQVELGDGGHLDVIDATLEDKYGSRFYNIKLPYDQNHYMDLMKWYGKNKMWNIYFYMKNFPDLRPKYAATVHKAQGATYDSVFIDLEDFNKCHNPVVLAKLLYVAVTRARSKVFFYGSLREKYSQIV